MRVALPGINILPTSRPQQGVPFGWPSALQLPSGEILASYYAGEGDRSSIYLRRLRLA